MRCFARCRLWDGSLRDLMGGCIIGRSNSADLVIDDPRVSEAHAMLSLRSGRLVLLSLRRMVQVDGKRVSEIELQENMEVHFAEDLSMLVQCIVEPESVLGIEGSGIPLRPLSPVSSLYGGSNPRVVGRFAPDADAHLWFLDGECRFSQKGGSARVLQAGAVIEIAGCQMTICGMSIAAAGHATTALTGSILSPLKIIVSYDSVQIQRANRVPVAFGGHSGRVICELAAYAAPVPWKLVAKELWPNSECDMELRRRWDVVMVRLRHKLGELSLRPDLVRTDGAGMVQLLLYPDDQVEDRG